MEADRPALTVAAAASSSTCSISAAAATQLAAVGRSSSCKKDSVWTGWWMSRRTSRAVRVWCPPVWCVAFMEGAGVEELGVARPRLHFFDVSVLLRCCGDVFGELIDGREGKGKKKSSAPVNFQIACLCVCVCVFYTRSAHTLQFSCFPSLVDKSRNWNKRWGAFSTVFITELRLYCRCY